MFGLGWMVLKKNAMTLAWLVACLWVDADAEIFDACPAMSTYYLPWLFVTFVKLIVFNYDEG